MVVDVHVFIAFGSLSWRKGSEGFGKYLYNIRIYVDKYICVCVFVAVGSVCKCVSVYL